MKLLQHQKDTIRRKLLAEKFNPLFANLDEERLKLALSIIKPAQDLIKNLPSNFFEQKQHVYCNFDGNYVNFELKEAVFLPHYAVRRIPFNIDTDEYKAWHSIEARTNELHERKNELSSEINSVLKAINSHKKLEEVWPDALKYLDKEPSLPATTDISKLQTMLNSI